MNVSREDAALDRVLRDLPRWAPSPDFGQRLAAAAARQHSSRRERSSPTRGAALLAIATTLAPWAVVSGVAAAMLAELPWEALSRHPVEIGLLASAGIVAAGLRMTVRLLRS